MAFHLNQSGQYGLNIHVKGIQRNLAEEERLHYMPVVTSRGMWGCKTREGDGFKGKKASRISQQFKAQNTG